MKDVHNAAQANGREPVSFVWFQNYIDLFGSDEFQHSLKNLVIYTVVFLVGTMVFGFLWAWLLDRPVKFEGVLPLHLPLPDGRLVRRVRRRVALAAELEPGRERVGPEPAVPDDRPAVPPEQLVEQRDVGIAAIAIPAIWQLSGYVMALFLAGFRGVPEELREAARMDGSSTWQMYRHVIFPQLAPSPCPR